MKIPSAFFATFTTLILIASIPIVTRAQAFDPNTLIAPYNPGLDAVAPPASGTFGTGKVWKVGPTEANTSFKAIAGSLGNGDIVEIDAATYGCSEQSIVWYANNITVVGVGGRPVFNATGCTIDGDKGIFNPRGHNLIVSNIEFAGAAGPSANDAGIRYDGSGYVYLTNDYFHDNQDGILMTPDPTQQNDLVIDQSEFAHNGDGSGQSHNMYISSGWHSFVLRESYSHDANVGHEVKSRAPINYILYNRLADEANGNASYEIDIPQGGLSYIIGNVIQKGANEQNHSIIEYACEGNPNPTQKIYVAYNTLVDTLGNGWMFNICDYGITEAVSTNNLIVGATKGVGSGIGKVAENNNLYTASPGFVDQNNRVYYLTAASPAVNQGTAPGTYNSFLLSPFYQFQFPATAVARTTQGAPDIGAYEYITGQVVPAAPAIAFSAQSSNINYGSQAVLTWSAGNATSCSASGDWSGSEPTSGSYTSPPLTSNKNYTISCAGSGGSASASVSITVNDSAAAAALGTYSWRPIPNTAFDNVCAMNLKNPDGSLMYADNEGTGPWCDSKSNAAFIYDPDTAYAYLIGGGGGRNYYGNEVYGLNLTTAKPEMVVPPTHISQTKEYTPSDYYGNMLHFGNCGSAEHLLSGGVTMGPRGISGQAAYDPITKKIVIEPGGFNNGATCSTPDYSITGQMLTDMWSFDPIAKTFTLLSGPNWNFSSVSTPSNFFDPVTGIGYTAGNRNQSGNGGYLINYRQTPPSTALVDNVWQFGYGSDPTAVDTTHHYALDLETSGIAVYNLNNLALTNYGTAGGTGSTGTAGGSGPLYKPDTSWTVTGDTTLLGLAGSAGITYNPNIDKFVAWAGGGTLYFLTPDYTNKTLQIVSKTVSGNPTSTNAPAHFLYLPDRDVYLEFTGLDQDEWLLYPPSQTTVTGIPPSSGSTVTQSLPTTTTQTNQTQTTTQNQTNQTNPTTNQNSQTLTNPSNSSQPSVSISVSPSTIEKGNSGKLIWSSSGATSCQGTNFIPMNTSGSLDLFGVSSLVFSISCTGPGGTASGSATLTVTVNGHSLPIQSQSQTISSITQNQNTSGASGLTSGVQVETTDQLNVRANPGTGGSLVCIASKGMTATLLNPTTVNGVTWWNLRYDNGCLGWSVQTFLVSSASSNATSSVTSVLKAAKLLTVTLSYGSNGSQVLLLQLFLKNHGFFKGDATGFFGSITQSALVKYQCAAQIACTYSAGAGIAGPKTRALVNKGLY